MTDRAVLLRATRSIESRTGIRAIWDLRDGSVFFYYSNPDFGVTAEPIKRRNGEVRSLSQRDIDRIIEYIRLGKRSREVKDRWIAQHKKAREDAKVAAMDKRLDDYRPEGIARMKHSREKAGMHTGWKKSQVVNGLKETK